MEDKSGLRKSQFISPLLEINLPQGKFHVLLVETYSKYVRLLRPAGTMFFDNKRSFRIERFESSRTNWFTLSTFSAVRDEVGRPDLGFSSVEPISFLLTHFQMTGILGSIFK